jgi:cobalt-precorrin 5A hydrolase
MELGEAVIVAGIGSRKGVSAAEVIAAVETALKEYGLEMGALTALATTEFKREEAGIFEAGEMLGLRVVVVTPAEGLPSSPPLGGEVVSEANRRGGELPAQRIEKSPSPSRANALDTSPPKGGEERSLSGARSLEVAGVASVSEAAALATAGEGARLAGPRIAVGPVTCAIAFGGGEP